MGHIYELTALGVGAVTMIVIYVVMRQHSTFSRAAIPLGICSGALAALGILHMAKEFNGLLIPWVTLGIVLTVLLLIRFLARQWNLIVSVRGTGFAESKKKWKKPKKQSPWSSPQFTGSFNPPIGALHLSNDAPQNEEGN